MGMPEERKPNFANQRLASNDSNTVIYQELRELAARYLRKERRDQILRTTALAHEVYVRLAAQGRLPQPSRAAFCAAAAQMVRRILVDHARRRRALKRRRPVEPGIKIESAVFSRDQPVADLLDLDDALRRLENLAPRQARIVELRYFGGLSEEETAAVLGLARRTVQLDWRGARAWFKRELAGGGRTETTP